ncbi:MAG: hypothetical protein OXC12_08115 [Spirochaetaceae bacterium]|nr:hypothetical protein [Spirochaetaceae bacterium]
MTTHVAPVPPQARPGDTVLVDGRPEVVLRLLPHLRGRPPAARLTSDLPCGTCEEPLSYDALRRQWRCSECRSTYDGEALGELVREHVRDGVRAGKSRRERGTRARQVARGAPGAAAVLLRAAAAGGAPGRAVLLREVTGPERRALAWALRDAGSAPLSAECCRMGAAELATLTPTSLDTPP